MPRIAVRRSERVEETDPPVAPWLDEGQRLPPGWHPGLPPPNDPGSPLPPSEPPPQRLSKHRGLLALVAMLIIGIAAMIWLRPDSSPPPPALSPGVLLELDARAQVLRREIGDLEAERAALETQVQALQAQRDTAAAAERTYRAAVERLEQRLFPPSEAGPEPEAGAPVDASEDLPAALVASEPDVGLPPRPLVPPAAPRTAAPPTPAGSSPRVFIHAPPAALAAGRAIAGRLSRDGWTVAGVRPSPGPISRTTVRYFFAEDRQAAGRLLGDVRAVAGGGATTPQSFTTYRPLPSAGTLEVWLSGSG